jgi:hypothetical protein
VCVAHRVGQLADQIEASVDGQPGVVLGKPSVEPHPLLVVVEDHRWAEGVVDQVVRLHDAVVADTLAQRNSRSAARWVMSRSASARSVR